MAPHAPHEPQVTVFKPSPSGPAEDEIITAQITRCDQDGTVMVELTEPWARTVPAQTMVAVNEADIGRSVALRCLRDPARTPVILGFMHPSARLPQARPSEVHVDGKKLVLTADNEIELRCGRASLVLTRDGRVEVHGANVSSRASELQKIRGGDVQIN